MSTDPTAQAAFRVPRSEIDALYDPGEQSPASRPGVGVVVSVDSSNLCTILINDDEISGVMWLGFVPPRVGDVVELEMRGDLLVVPAINDIDTFMEGMDETVEHIVSASNPGSPPAEELQVGGSMRSTDAWAFWGADTTNWSRELSESGQGMRLFQPAPPVLVARNMATIPSGEAGIGPDEYGKSWTGADTQSGTYSSTAQVESTTELSYAGSLGLKATWKADPKPSCVSLRTFGHTVGTQYTAQIRVYVPTSSQDVRLVVQGVAAGAVAAVKDSWVQLTLTYTATAAEQIIGITTPAGTPTLAGVAYLDAFSVIAGATPLAVYFDGDTVDNSTDQYVWRGDKGLSASEHYTGSSTPAVLIARNLVLNPSMETPNGAVPKGISFSGNATGASDTTWKNSGVTSLRVEPTPTGTNDSWAYVQGASTSANITNILQPGKTYTIIATSRLAAALTGTLHAHSRQIQISYHSVAGFAGSTAVYSGGMPNVADTVVTQRVTVTIPASAMWAVIRLGCGAAAGGGAVWWDDVCVVEDTYSGDYFDGSTPAQGDAFYSWTGTAHDSTSTRQHYTGAIPPPVLLGTNLLANPSFEVDTSRWAGIRATLTRQIDLTGARTGGAVARLVNDGSVNTHYLNVATANRLPVVPGQTVTFSAYARLVTGTGTNYIAKVWFYDAAGVVIGTSVAGTPVTLPADSSWVRLSVTTIAPALAATVGPAVSSQSLASTDTWEVDACLAEFSNVVGDYFDGATPATEDAYYRWEGTAHASTSTHWTAPPLVDPGPAGILWSEMTFDVSPGDIVHFEMDLGEIDKDSTAQVYALYGGVGGAAPLPGDSATVQAAVGSALALTAAISTLSASLTIPATVTLPVVGAVPPATVKLGVRLVGTGTSQVLAIAARATQTPAGWPLGSQWMNPDADQGALVTIQEMPLASVTGILTNAGTVDNPIPSAKKAVITAPPTSGGIAVVTFTGSFRFKTSSASTYLTLWDGTQEIALNYFTSTPTPDLGSFPFVMRGTIALAPGQEVTVTPRYRYSSTSTTVPHDIVRMQTSAEFYPGAVRSAGSSDAPTSYWDGDSWRPETLLGAVIDLSKDATVAVPTKTNTTTTLARSVSTLHAGGSLTLTATVTTGATGTVVFSQMDESTGIWTTLGSGTLSSGKATKTFAIASPGTYSFKAVYGGSPTHNPSTSATLAGTKVQKAVSKTVVLPCSWAQAYNGDGSKVTGTSADTAVYQGQPSIFAPPNPVPQATPAETIGNRKSLLRFDHSSIPAAATITAVSLVAKSGGWALWWSGDGTLVVGSFVSQATVPTTWPSSKTDEDRSRHAVSVGGWTVNLSAWANAALEASTFNGIVIGPGVSTSTAYYGYSSAPGKDQFTLKVTYDVWE